MVQKRRLRQWGGGLALFAVWLQLVLSFAHMHPEDVFGSRNAATAQSQGTSRPASDHPSSGDDRDGCAICAAMQLAATALPPPPTLLQVPLDPIGTVTPEGNRPFAAADPFRLFQSRAPPLV